MGKKNSSSRRALSAETRAAKAYELRCHGKSFREIADQLGFASAGAAYDAFSRGRSMVTKEKVDEARDAMVYRLSLLRAAAMPAATKGHLQAIDTVLKIDRREAELLGIEAQQAPMGGNEDAKASLKAKIELFMERTKRAGTLQDI